MRCIPKVLPKFQAKAGSKVKMDCGLSTGKPEPLKFRFTASSPDPCTFKIYYYDTSKKWWLDGAEYASGETASLTPDDGSIEHTIEIEDSPIYDINLYSKYLQFDTAVLSTWDVRRTLSIANNSACTGKLSDFRYFKITHHLEVYNTQLTGDTSVFRNFTCDGYVTMEGCHFTGSLKDFANMQPMVFRISYNDIIGDLADIRHFNKAYRRALDHCPLTTFSKNDTLFASSLDIRLYSCTLDRQSIDNILVAVDNDGFSNGSLQIQNNSAPTQTGLNAISSLEAKGWTVTYDS